MIRFHVAAFAIFLMLSTNASALEQTDTPDSPPGDQPPAEETDANTDSAEADVPSAEQPTEPVETEPFDAEPDAIAEPIVEPQPQPVGDQPPPPATQPTHNPYMPDSNLPHHKPTPVEATPEVVKPAPKPGDDPLVGVGGDGVLVVRVAEPKPPVLFVNPELSLGGMFSNYRQLGFFTYFAFGGGVGLTLNEEWHFRINVWALGEPHSYKPGTQVVGDAPLTNEERHALWFVQPAAYVMYNVARFPDYHYFVPMDLYLGVKLGANIFMTDKEFYNVKSENNFLWGVALYPRFYLYKRAFGIAPAIELSTIDYFRNFFFHYGLTFFWDFEVIGAPGE